MRIALSFPGCHRKGGVERIVFECARYLASRRHEVTVYANEWEVDDTQEIRYQKVEMSTRPDFVRPSSYFRAAERALKGESFEVLNTHGCVCPLGGVQWVQSVHRAWLERSRGFRSAHSPARLKQRLNPLHPVLLRLEAKHFRERNYSKVIATTEDVRNDLNRLYGVPREDVVVVPNGFSPTEFNPARRAEHREAMRAKLGLQPTNIAMLFVANELERKGYPTLLAAMKELKRPDLRLLVVGRPDPAVVKELAIQAGLEKQVIACGATSQVASFHAASDLFVLPTQYEAFCLAILEALGSGLPVVTSSVPGAHDAIKSGVNGYIIQDPKSGRELSEALERALAPGHLDELSAQAPETVRCYQWPNVLERYEDVLFANRK